MQATTDRCPLCGADKSAAADHQELRLRLEWMQAERDAWRDRALKAELSPGRPYRMEEEQVRRRKVTYWGEIKAADGRKPILCTRHTARALLEDLQKMAAQLAEERVDYEVDVWRDERWVEDDA